jgi:hypothetical protein
MPDPVTGMGKRPEVAAMHRRAAAMFLHWRQGDTSTEGVMAVLAEMKGLEEFGGVAGADAAWVGLIVSMLMVGNEMVRAALDGKEDEYLRSVIRRASLDEVATAGG